jgi:hypothetical protein
LGAEAFVTVISSCLNFLLALAVTTLSADMALSFFAVTAFSGYGYSSFSESKKTGQMDALNYRISKSLIF